MQLRTLNTAIKSSMSSPQRKLQGVNMCRPSGSDISTYKMNVRWGSLQIRHLQALLTCFGISSKSPLWEPPQASLPGHRQHKRLYSRDLGCNAQACRVVACHISPSNPRSPSMPMHKRPPDPSTLHSIPITCISRVMIETHSGLLWTWG
jgi:hypothetical protein